MPYKKKPKGPRKPIHVPDDDTLLDWIAKYPTKTEYRTAPDVAGLTTTLRYAQCENWTEMLVKYELKGVEALRMAGLNKEYVGTIEDAVAAASHLPAKDAPKWLARNGYRPHKQVIKKYGSWENAREAVGLARCHVYEGNEVPHLVYLIYFPEIDMYKCGITVRKTVEERDRHKWKLKYDIIEKHFVDTKSEALIIEKDTLNEYTRRASPLDSCFKGNGHTEFFVSEKEPYLIW